MQGAVGREINMPKQAWYAAGRPFTTALAESVSLDSALCDVFHPAVDSSIPDDHDLADAEM